jgi:hypothetical protein
LALKPWEFWRLTPHEFRLMFAGIHRRDDRAWHKVATLGLWILAPHSKKKLTILGLLGRPGLHLWPHDDAPPTEPSEEMLEEMREAALQKMLAWAKD